MVNAAEPMSKPPIKSSHLAGKSGAVAEPAVPDVVAAARARVAQRRKEREMSESRRNILQAIIELGPHAYGNMIHQQLVLRHGDDAISFGQIYGALKRMSEDEYLTSYSAPSSIPGARGVTVYELTEKAKKWVKA